MEMGPLCLYPEAFVGAQGPIEHCTRPAGCRRNFEWCVVGFQTFYMSSARSCKVLRVIVTMLEVVVSVLLETVGKVESRVVFRSQSSSEVYRMSVAPGSTKIVLVWDLKTFVR